MRPTPAHIAALLALPLDARRRLAAQEGPGLLLDDRRHNRLQRTNVLADAYVKVGWAWLPCDSAAVMEAATPSGGWWRAETTDEGPAVRWSIYRPPTEAPDDYGDSIAEADTALDCALAALAAQYPEMT